MALVEVLISTVVISTGILAIFMLFVQLQQGSNDVHVYDDANLLAYNQLEQFKNTITKSQFDQLQSGTKQIELGSGKQFDVSWDILKLGHNLKKIKIKVNSGHIKVEIEHDLVWKDPVLSMSVASHVQQDKVPLSFNELDWLANHITTKPGNEKQKYELSGLGKVIVDNKNDWYFIDQKENIVLSGKFKESDDITQLIQIVYGRIFVAKSNSDNFFSEYFLEVSGGGQCFLMADFNDIDSSNWRFIDFQCVVNLHWQGKLGIVSVNSKQQYCPSAARTYQGYQIVDGKIHFSGIDLKQQLQDFIIKDTESCDNVVEEINQVLQTQVNSVLIDENTIKNSLIIDQQKLISFIGEVSFVPLDADILMKKAHFTLTSQGANADYLCQIINPLPDIQSQFHCALALEKESAAFWQGHLDVEVEYLKNNDVFVCNASTDIDTSIKNDYKLSCQTL